MSTVSEMVVSKVAGSNCALSERRDLLV